MGERRLPEPSTAPVFEDSRGRLTLVEFDKLNFAPSRAYVLDSIPVGGRRAGHASRTQHRLLLGLSGRAAVTLDDGRQSARVELEATHTLEISPGTWLDIEALTDRTAVLVVADGDYDPGDVVVDRAALPLASPTAAKTSET